MDITELEKFYSLGNVEGLAFIDNKRVLVENQMLISRELAQTIAESFLEIFAGLSAAGRTCRGFFLKTSRRQFLGIPVPGGAVVLQLDPKQDVDICFRQARAITGDHLLPQAAPGRVPEPSQPEKSEALVPDTSAVSSAEVNEIWPEFSASLTEALDQVVSQDLARELISRATVRILAGEATPSNLEQIYAIGQFAISAVRSAGRRKMVEKELKNIAETLGIPILSSMGAAPKLVK